MGVCALTLDQWCKMLAQARIPLNQARELIPGIRIEHTHTQGWLFDALAQASGWERIAGFGLAGAIFCGLLLALLAQERSRPALQCGIALLLSGAMGNLIDHIGFGYIVNVAQLGAGWLQAPLHFNLADAFLALGALLIALHALIPRRDPGPWG